MFGDLEVKPSPPPSGGMDMFGGLSVKPAPATFEPAYSPPQSNYSPPA